MESSKNLYRSNFTSENGHWASAKRIIETSHFIVQMKNWTLSSTRVLNNIWVKNWKTKRKNARTNKIIHPLFWWPDLRTVWDDEHSKWFSILDIVAVLNEEPDYSKTRNYWKYLKAKLKKENSQLVSDTTQLKLTTADGKKYKTDLLDSEGIIELSKNFPNTKATKFLDWFLYSDTSIDGQSKKKAYTLIESNFKSANLILIFNVVNSL